MVSENLRSWVAVDVSSSQIDIEFTMENLLSVSQGDSADTLAITICAQEYNTTDGEPMPDCLYKSAFLPRQVLSESEKQTLTTIADSA